MRFKYNQLLWLLLNFSVSEQSWTLSINAVKENDLCSYFFGISASIVLLRIFQSLLPLVLLRTRVY